MPRVVPSEVVSAIDGMFGPSRNVLDVDMIRFVHRDNVRTLLWLMNEVSGDLIQVPFQDYVEYLRARAALTSASNTWDAGDRDRPVENPGGHDPVERIRRTLAVCPDESLSPIPDLAFIPDAFARAGIQQDIRAAWVDFRADEWKGATVFAATAVEALLFWTLRHRPDVGQPEKLVHQNLRTYIGEAQRLKIISDAAASQALLAADVRNLIHAGKIARTGLICTKATALTALAALEAVLEELP